MQIPPDEEDNGSRTNGLSRRDLSIVPRDYPVVTWLAQGPIPPMNEAGPRDKLILATAELPDKYLFGRITLIDLQWVTFLNSRECARRFVHGLNERCPHDHPGISAFVIFFLWIAREVPIVDQVPGRGDRLPHDPRSVCLYLLSRFDHDLLVAALDDRAA